jgi:hypothetical protein
MPPADGGYALLWRKFLEHPYWTEKRTFSRAEAWMDCWFGMAAYNDHTRVIAGQVVRIQRGQFVASDRFLERRWRWSRSKVRRFMAGAVESGELSHVGEVFGACTKNDTAGGTVYVVVNYDNYQSRDTGADTAVGPRTDHARTTHEPKRSKGTKGSKEKKEKEYIGEFDAAWAEYPTRAGSNSKPDAYSAWNARVKEGVSPAEMLAGVKRYAAFCHHTGKLRSEYVMQARRFFGPSRQYAEPWAIPADGRGAPGSQAAAVRDERPQATGPRLNRPTPAGSDPADERSREAEEDERVERWRQQYPAEAEAIAAQVQTEMAADARWKGTPKGIVEAAARSRYRSLILARLGPRAA